MNTHSSFKESKSSNRLWLRNVMKLCDKRLKCKYMYITLYISSQIHINTTGATIEAGTTHSYGALEFTPGF
jgi:hypothetical protein